MASKVSKYKVILEFEYKVTPLDTQEWLDSSAESWVTNFSKFLKEKHGIEDNNLSVTLEEYE